MSKTTFKQCDIERAAMSEPPHKPARRRRPTLSAALKAAKKAGTPVKSAVVEDGKVTLFFGDGTEVTGTNENENEWTERLRDLGYGKN
jgi:hypothetical protein